MTKPRLPLLTVADLVAALQQMPPDACVFVDGYEWGIETPRAPRLAFARFHGKDAFGGAYDAVEPGAERDGDVPAVLLARDD